ncbi:MAG: glycerophosphodiester phosphodiesterase [Pyrinomonadaceae bacterium]
MNAPLIIAHRGASAAAPENTLAAFRRATECGAEGVEFDVRLAADGVPVVIHDATLERTAGRREAVSQLTSRELARADVGSWFNRARPKLANDEFAGEGVPTLASVLDLLAGFDGRLYVELKSEDADLRPLCRAVAGTLADSPALERAIVKSFRLAAVPTMRVLLPDVRTAALFAPVIETVVGKKRHILTVAREMGADELSLHRALATPRFAAEAGRAGMPVTVWTVDSPNYLTLGAKMGLKAIITNDPEKMLARRRGDI